MGGYLQYIFLGKELPHFGHPQRSTCLPATIQRHMSNTEGTAAAKLDKTKLPVKKNTARKIPTSARAATTGRPWYAKTTRRWFSGLTWCCSIWITSLVVAEGDELALAKLWRNASFCACSHTECNRRSSTCCDADACPEDRAASCAEGPAWPRDFADRVRRN